jgi:hypothetical protein
MKKEYTVKNKNGSWWVMTPKGEAIAVPHKTKSEAQLIANVFNRTKRDPKTVRTVADEKKETKPYALIVVHGGVAYLNKAKGCDVDILDLDNLKDLIELNEKITPLSEDEEAFLKKDNPEMFARYEKLRAD